MQMVWFTPQPQPQPEAELEPQPTDFALADSFINFDYVPDCFHDDNPIPDMPMPAQHNNNNNGSDPIAVGSGTSGCASIEKGIQKISLVGGCGSSVRIGGNGDIGHEIIITNNNNNNNNNNNEDKDKGESESSESESESASSSSSSSTSSASSSDSEDKEEEEQKRDEKGEVEEGEIIDSDANDGDDSGEDLEEVASWGIVHDDDGDVDDDDDDDDDRNRAVGRPVMSKNEIEILPSVPPVNVTLEPRHQMLPVGVVVSILGAQVIVEGVQKHDPLNEGSILWMTESRTPLGLIDEIFGPVKNPYYVVRYNSENEVPEGIHGGTLISFVPEFANHVLNNNKDLYKKGYDASGLNDEEVSDEADFSDDEKEAEYKRMQRMTKRGINGQNLGKRKNNRKKVPPATPLLDHGNCSPFSGSGQGLFGATTVVPPFPPANAGPNLNTSAVWTNGTTLPQPQSAMLPNEFNTIGVSWYPENTQIPHQLPVSGSPFQRQLNPSHGFPPATMFPGVQPKIFAQPMYAQGLVGQNQMTFGLNSPLLQIHPPLCAGQQGFFSSELQSETNRNLHSSSIPFNHNAPHQFYPGASASHGRKTFHRGGRKGWRPAK